MGFVFLWYVRNIFFHNNKKMVPLLLSQILIRSESFWATFCRLWKSLAHKSFKKITATSFEKVKWTFGDSLEASKHLLPHDSPAPTLQQAALPGQVKEPRDSVCSVITVEALGQTVTCFAVFQVNDPNKQGDIPNLNEVTM